MNTAYRFVYPFLPVIARGLGVPLEQAALLVSVRHFSGLATPAVGRLAGAGERQRKLIVTGIVLFVVGAAITALTSVYVGALVGFALLGLAKPVFDVSSQSYIAARVPYERRARYLATFEFTWAGSLLIGAPATGWLIARTDWRAPFIVFAVLSAVALAMSLRLIDADDREVPENGGRERFTPSARAFLAVAGLFALASEMIVVVFGAWLEDSFGLSLLALGGAAFLIGASELTGESATFAFTDRIGKRRAVLAGLVVSGIGYALLVPASGSLGIGLAVLAVALFGFEFTIVSSIPLASELMPRTRTRYLGWMVVAMSLARGIGAAIGPILFASFGIPGPAAAALVSVAVATVILNVGVHEGAHVITPEAAP